MVTKLLILIILFCSLFYIINNHIRSIGTEASISYQTQWGSVGSADGEFDEPLGITVDKSNDWVYVADTLNDRIQKFDTSGNFITKWGQDGTAAGEFKNVSDVAVDSSGNVYTSDLTDSRIQVFDSDGVFLRSWNLTNPASSIAIDTNDNVYIIDFNAYQVIKFQSDGTEITSWGTQGSDNGQFNMPEDIAIDSNNLIYISDSFNKNVQVFDANGTFNAKWLTPGQTTPNTWGVITTIATDTFGKILVYELTNTRIIKLNSSGLFVESLSSIDGNSFGSISGMDFDSNGNMYLTDTSNDRIIKYLNIDATPVPISGNNSGGGGSSIYYPPSTTEAPNCTAEKPIQISDLFRIDTAGTYANIYFTTTNSNTSGYTISYGMNNTASQFADSFDYNGKEWVIGRTINYLQPYTTYFFKVRPTNGCNAGVWSKIVSAKTKGRFSNIKNFFANLSPLANRSNTVSLVNTNNSSKNPIIECEYTVLKNDSLWKIAERKWGDGRYYPQIITLNPTMKLNLKVGQKIKLCN